MEGKGSGAAAVAPLDETLARLSRLLERGEKLLERFLPEGEEDPAVFHSHHAFRWESRGGAGRMVPVRHPHLVDLETLIGIDFVKDEIIRNTAQFVAGLPANNVLLWGDRGIGKSSCVKGLLPLFRDRGLRIVEVQRGDLLSLPDIVARIRDLPYRFIIFCDDLSFGEGDSSYQELKTLLDGGIEARPENLLIYATSNRRHLMPERMEDNLRVEIHPEENVADKLSLADRFGLSLGIEIFSQDKYLAAVELYAGKAGIPMTEELRRQALHWTLRKGQRSGRVARQFVDDAAGRLALEKEKP